MADLNLPHSRKYITGTWFMKELDREGEDVKAVQLAGEAE